jgi:PTH1 family peptidyl-tRNA hydrolase
VVSALCHRHGGRFKRARQFIRADVADIRIGGTRAILAVPRTFMNESGAAVAPLLRYHRGDLDDLVVVHDDIDLPFAKLRLQYDRGSGGNNGARSVIGALGTTGFWRLKCGVGRPPGAMDPAVFVLRRFAAAERDDVAHMVVTAADVLERFVTEGAEAARQAAGESGPQG